VETGQSTATTTLRVCWLCFNCLYFAYLLCTVPISICMCFLCTGKERPYINIWAQTMDLLNKWIVSNKLWRNILEHSLWRPNERYVISAPPETSGYLVKMSAQLKPRAHDASWLAQVKSWGCASKHFMEAMRSPAGWTWNRIAASLMRHARASSGRHSRKPTCIAYTRLNV